MVGMKQTQESQVVQALAGLGGLATFRQLNKALAPLFSEWKTKTPEASVRAIVQRSKEIFKIKPGLWGLTSLKEQFSQFEEKGSPSEHYHYQGLLLDLGGFKNFATFAPNQDKNRPFVNSTLGETRTLDAIYDFSYPKIVKRSAMIDVLWFNRRKMPQCAFEVDLTTDFANSLLRFLALQDFNVRFYAVADASRRAKFVDVLQRDEYTPIRTRVDFIDTEELGNAHSDFNKKLFRQLPFA